MICALYSVVRENANGAGYWLLFCAVCYLLYIVSGLLVSRLRTLQAFKRLAACGVCGGALCDAIWFFVFYSHGAYRNGGIQSAYLRFCCPRCSA